MTDLTGRIDFVETWLAEIQVNEMPTGLGSFDTFDTISWVIKERIANGNTPVQVQPGVKKLVGQEVLYYWFEKNNDIVLGVELYIKPQSLVVSLTGKNPNWISKPPYASDLYNIILTDNKRSLRLMSDNSLSDEGYAIWKRLLNQGHKISVYDKENPGSSFVALKSLDDMAKYFAHDDTNFKRYQYVLSKSNSFLDVLSHFNIRRHRELIPGLL